MTVTVVNMNGAKSNHLAEVEVRSITTTTDENMKVLLTGGKLAVDLITGSYRYGDEIQLNYWTKVKPEYRRRVDKDHEYFRTEIHMSKEQAARLIRAIMDSV